MKNKKVLSMILAVAMVSGLLAGCGKSEESSSPVQSETSSETVEESSQESTEEAVDSGRISEEVITVTMAGHSAPENVYGDTIQFAGYERDLGIKFEATTYTQEQWKSKLPIMLAADEMPDIITKIGLTPQEVDKYAKEGYFLDISQYLDVMPNLCALMEEYPYYASALKNDEGKIYAIRGFNRGSVNTLFTPTFINKQWLENVGKEVPQTLDELYDVLVAFRDGDANGNGDPNDEIPLGFSGVNQKTEHTILWGFGIPGTAGSYNLMVENGDVVLGDATDNYKEFLKYMNKLYEEGLIMKDAYVITADEANAQIPEDRVGMVATMQYLPGTPMERVTNYACLPGFTSEYSDEHVVVQNNRVYTAFDIAVNADTEYPEEICKFLDTLYTDEGYVAARFGYEGESFDWKEVAGGMICDQSAYKKAYEEKNPNGVTFDYTVRAADVFSIIVSDVGSSNALMANAETIEDLYAEDMVEVSEQNILREVMLRGDVSIVDIYPRVAYTDAELEERATLYTDIYNYLKSVKSEFIVGSRDIDATWDSHLAELNKMGLERLMEIEQAAYDRFVAK